jgi:hypothetical protein
MALKCLSIISVVSVNTTVYFFLLTLVINSKINMKLPVKVYGGVKALIESFLNCHQNRRGQFYSPTALKLGNSFRCPLNRHLQGRRIGLGV